jgi:hypothetical protein
MIHFEEENPDILQQKMARFDSLLPMNGHVKPVWPLD